MKVVEKEVFSKHVQMVLEILARIAIWNFMGYVEGKSVAMIYEKFSEVKYKHRNREFWCI